MAVFRADKILQQKLVRKLGEPQSHSGHSGDGKKYPHAHKGKRMPAVTLLTQLCCLRCLIFSILKGLRKFMII